MMESRKLIADCKKKLRTTKQTEVYKRDLETVWIFAEISTTYLDSCFGIIFVMLKF